MPLKKIANEIQEVAAVDMNLWEENAGKNGGGRFCIALHQFVNMTSGGDFLGHPLHSVWGRGNIGRPCDFLR